MHQPTPSATPLNPDRRDANFPLVALLAVALPLVFNPFGVQAFEPFKMTAVRLAALSILAVFAAGCWRRGLPVVPAAISPLPLAALALLASTILSTGLSVLPLTSLLGSYDRLQGLLSLAALLAVATATACSPTLRQAPWRLADLLLAGSLAPCLYALLQHFRLDPLTWLDRGFGPSSTIGSSTALGGYMAALMPLTLVRLARTRSGTSASPPHLLAGLTLLLGLQATTLLVAGVRGAVFGGLAGILVAALALFRLRHLTWLASTTLGLTLGVGLTIGVLNLLPESVLGRSPPLFQRFGDTLRVDQTGRERLLVWQAALQTAAAGGTRLLVGFGPETQATVLEQRLPVELANRLPDQRFDRAHDLAVDQLLTAGLVGLCALVGLLVTTLVVAWRRASQGPLAAGLLGATVAYCVQSIFAFDSATTLTVFWLLFGLLCTLDSGPSSVGPARPPRPRRALAVGLSLVALTLLPPVLSPVFADLAYRRALAYHGGKDPPGEVVWLGRAELLAPDRDLYPLARTVALMAHLPAERSSERRQAQLEQAVESLRRALALNSLDPYTWLQAGSLAEIRAEARRDPTARSDAVADYAMAAQLSPNRAALHDSLALALLRDHRPLEALASIERAVMLEGAAAERVARTGDALRGLGRLSEARGAYLAALRLDRRSSLAHAGLAELARLEANYPSALESARLAARYQVQSWEQRERLAEAALAAGSRDEAVRAARAAIRLAPAWELDRLRDRLAAIRATEL